MSTHRVFIGNGVYPGFNSTAGRYRDYGARVDRIADHIRRSGADCAAMSETGYWQAQQLARALGWKYDRTQGTGNISGPGEGMNTALYNPEVWDQPDGRVSDYNLPSAGQWQRTLLVQRLVEKRDPSAFFGLTVGHSTLGDAGGLAYVKAMIYKIGDRRVLVGMDLKRTQDTDDLAAIGRAGFKVHGRTSKTPMVCLTKGAIRITAVDYIADLRAFDHTALSVEFTLPSAA